MEMMYDSDDDDHQNRGVYAYIYANRIMRCMPFEIIIPTQFLYYIIL